MTERYLVPSYGPDVKALSVALLAATTAAGKHQCSITLCVPAMKYAEDSVLDKVLAENFIKNLVKGKACTLDGHPVQMKSTQNINPFSERGILVGLWSSKKMLAKLDKANQAKAIIALPWIEEDTEQWAKKWSPTVLKVNEA